MREKDRGFNWSGVVIAIARVRRPGLGDSENAVALRSPRPQIEALTVKRIGEVLMTDYVWPLQCVGVLLTAALIGALILVMEENERVIA